MCVWCVCVRCVEKKPNTGRNLNKYFVVVLKNILCDHGKQT